MMSGRGEGTLRYEKIKQILAEWRLGRGKLIYWEATF
jgi:hypothetical protein